MQLQELQVNLSIETLKEHQKMKKLLKKVHEKRFEKRFEVRKFFVGTNITTSL